MRFGLAAARLLLVTLFPLCSSSHCFPSAVSLDRFNAWANLQTILSAPPEVWSPVFNRQGASALIQPITAVSTATPAAHSDSRPGQSFSSSPARSNSALMAVAKKGTP